MKKLRITVDGKPYEVHVEILGEQGGAAPAAAPVSGSAAPLATSSVAPVATSAPKPAAAPAAGGAGDVLSPLSGKVVTVHVAVGASVTEGENLITLEAMKMNTFITAEAAGTVKSITCAAGDAVQEGQVLISLG